jgi:hypothetical protein
MVVVAGSTRAAATEADARRDFAPSDRVRRPVESVEIIARLLRGDTADRHAVNNGHGHDS